ncbi:hypothetical protein V8B97DRAFT_2011449 [Scleroderma yunnanense]
MPPSHSLKETDVPQSPATLAHFSDHENIDITDVLVPHLQGITISHNKAEELITTLQKLVTKASNNLAIHSGLPTPTRARSNDLDFVTN